MRSSARLLSGAVLAAALTACGGGGGGGGSKPNTDPSVWHLRGINVIADAPNIQFYVDDTAVATADYGAATDYRPARTGSRPIKLGAKNPPDLSGTDAGYSDIKPNESHDFQGPTDYTVVATGTVAAPQMLLMTGTSADAVPDNKVEWQVINAAVNAGSLQVVITAPEAGIAAPGQAKDTLAPGEYSTAANLDLAVATGATDTATRSVNITIELRDGATTVYKSSALNIAEQNRLLFVIADNIGPTGVKPVKIFAVAGIAAGAAGTLLDPADGAELRFSNLSPDAGPMDLFVGGNFDPTFYNDVSLGAPSDYSAVPAGPVNGVVTPGNSTNLFYFTQNFTASQDRSYTLYAQGANGDIRGLLIADERRSVPTEARLRFMHASPSEGGGALDIYVRQAGSTFDLNATTPPSPTVIALGYRSLSSSFVLKPGTYDLYVARAGAKTTILGRLDLALPAGGVQTLVLDDSALGALQVAPLDDARD